MIPKMRNYLNLRLILLKLRFNTWAILFLSLISSLLASPEDLFLPRIENINGTYDGFRLPTVAKPSRYDIRLSIPQEALTGGVTFFTGSENIIFQVSQSTNRIVMHSQVAIISVSLSALSAAQEVPILNHTQDARLETVTIITFTNLTASVDYTLTITFTGNLDPINMKGFYRSEYNVNGGKEYLGTTQFQPTHARKAFPCFDEPSFKAIIGLTLEYPLEFTAVANTPVLSNTSDTTTRITVFQDTPVMSTYLIAFTVSKFTCTHNVATGSIPYGVCSRSDFVADRALALQYGNELMAALDTWTDYPYNSTNIGKMDQFAIPDFSAGAMENWGLVTYREYMLLYNQEYTSNIYKQSIIGVIAHEFAHMWFGNLLTCEWWSYTFLNEGFARYFQYFLLNQITSSQDWEIEKQFIVAQQQSAFIVDSYVTSSSLTSNAWTPAQISNKFSTISYNKGASIYRMVENVIGSTVFQTSLRKYLANHAFSATTPDILWSDISADVPTENLPTGTNLIEVVANWTNEAGFPVISVTAIGNDVILSQKRFLYNNSATDLTEWYVPITYVTSNGTTTSTPLWLEPGTTVTLSNVLSGNSWIVVNHNSAGYYRVHYDINLRSRLEDALLVDHTLLTDIDRAQILDDALNLARAGQIRYSEVFRLLSYLKNDTSYYPWYVANRGIDYLSVRFGNDSELGQRIGSILLEHFDNNLANISSIDLDADTVSHVDSLKWQMLWSIACRLGHPTCISEAKKQFQNLRISNVRVNPNIRNVVYCNALRYSDNIVEDWNFLWSRLNTIDQAHESLYILSGLGCTRNKELLSNYLDQSINSSSVIRIQDLASVWSAVYGSGSVGLEVAFEKFRTNHAEILNYYSGAISVLSGIADRFTTQAELNQLQTFINENDANSTVGVAASAALTSAQRNLQWQSQVKGDLESHFGIAGSSATTLGISVFLLFISLFVVI